MAVIEATRLTDRVRLGLTELIAEQNLQPGDKLPPADRLCVRFSVSRTVVREAIASLKAEGRLRSLRGSGVFVSEPPQPSGGRPTFMADPKDIADVLDFLEVRMSVEIEAAGLAAERRTEVNLMLMEQALGQFSRQMENHSLATDADRAFHRAVAEATSNNRFRMFIDDMGDKLIPRRALGASFADEGDQRRFLQSIVDEHLRIFEAISDRQPDAARAAMRKHLEDGRRRYREWNRAIAMEAETR